MAEGMAPDHQPSEKFINAYADWAKGEWGMVLTGLSPYSSSSGEPLHFKTHTDNV